MYARKNGRAPFRSNRRSNYKKNINLFSNIKPRVKGNICQLYEKYSKLAKESSSSGDRIQAEYYYQFADHYSRLMNELGLKSFGNENKSESVSESVEEKTTPNEEQMTQDNEKNVLLNENILEKDSESIETVSFIAEPAKKSIQKSKKK